MHPRDFQHGGETWRGPRGLGVRWLGTAGFELTSPGGTLLIDPYLTRVGLLRFLSRRRITPDEAAIDRAIGHADAILVGHSHFDHVMDTPHIARRTGAHVYGSRSATNLMLANGLPETQLTALDSAERTTFEVGSFKITAVPSEHSRFAIGSKVPYPGDIPCTCEIDLKGSEYRCGSVFSFLIEYGDFRIYHMGSANLVEDQIPSDAKGADLFLVCIAARFATERFVQRALTAVEPKRVVPMHYDNMFRAADKPMWLLPRTAFGRLVDDIQEVSKDIEVLTLPLSHTKPPLLLESKP